MSEVHKIRMAYKRSTPGTHVFECPNDPCTTSIYVKKSAPFLNGKTPKAIILTIEEETGQVTEVDLT